MNAINLALFQWMSGGAHPSPGWLHLAIALASWAGAIGIGLMVLALWRHRAERVYVCVVGATAGLTGMAAQAIAQALNVPRPFVLGLVPAWIEHGARGSLPSTHAAVMFLVALAFLMRPGLRRIGVLVLALAAATGWARIYVGVHFPIDVVAGLLLAGTIVGALRAGQWAAQALTRPARRARYPSTVSARPLR